MTEAQRIELKRMPYSQFLKTAFWAAVKQRIHERDQKMCQMCGDERRTRLEVHHRRYEHHGHEDLHLEDLILLCDECHEDVTRKPGLRAWPFRDIEYRDEEGGYDNLIDDLRLAGGAA